MPTPLATMVRKVATCRLMLGIIAIVAVYADPTEPGFLPGLKLGGGGFAIDPYALAVLSAHLGYSLAVYSSLLVGLVPRGIVAITTWADILAGAAIAFFTDGPMSPFYVFFAFAVVAAGVRGGFRFSIAVTAVSIWIYMALFVVS